MEKKLKKKKLEIKKGGNKKQFADACSELGDYYERKKLYEQAINEYVEQAKTFQEAGFKMDIGLSHRKIGELYLLLDDFTNALKHVNIYLKVAIKQGNKLEEQRAYTTIGNVFYQHGTGDPQSSAGLFESAVEAYTKSLSICKSLNDKQVRRIEIMDMEARLYLNLGTTKEYLGAYEECIENWERAIDICKKNQFMNLLHKCYNCVAGHYCNLSNSIKALRYYNYALDVGKNLEENSEETCFTLLCKSEIFIKNGDFYNAKKDLYKAYKIKTKNKDDSENIEKKLKIAAALVNTQDSLITTNSTDYKTLKHLYELMGDGSCQLENYSKGIEYYLKCLQNAELNHETDKQLVPIYISLYQTYKDLKEFDLALIYYWKEYEICKNMPEEAFNTLINIADLYELMKKSFWDIEKLYQQARDMAKKIKDKNLEKKALVKLIALQRKEGMETLADILAREASISGINLEENEEELNTDDVNTEENNTPDIGINICLKDLSDTSSDNESECDRSIHSKRLNGFISIKRNNKGETKLHSACIAGDITFVRRLLDLGHPINVRDNFGWLPLHEACNYGYKDIVELLLEKGATSLINAKCTEDGITPLHDSLTNGHLEIAEVLLDNGADASIMNNKGETPLKILDDWRARTDLDTLENIFYETIRKRLFDISSIMSNHNESFNQHKISTSPIRGDCLENSVLNKKEQNIICSNDSNVSKISRNKRSFNKISKLRHGIDLIESDDESLPNLVKCNININNSDSESSTDNHETTVSDNTEKIVKRSAFLNENEVVDEDWMINDTLPSAKKRKVITDSIIYPTEKRNTLSTSSSSSTRNKLTLSNKSITPISNAQLSSNEKSNRTSSLIDIDDDDDNSVDAFDILLRNQSLPRNNKNKKRRKNLSLSLNRNKPQSSLFDSGFSRSFIENNEQQRRSSIDSTSSIESNVNVSPKKLIGNLVTHKIKVKVENQLLMIPINSNMIDTLTIGWLAKEAGQRYYKLNGLCPELRLTTVDGAILVDSDQISLIIDDTINQINSIVMDWKLPSLPIRYMDACTELNCIMDKSLHSDLEHLQNSQNFILSNQLLDLTIVRPLFKALNHETTIIYLDLSNNIITNECLKYFSQSLPTLKHLKILNLSGNLITSDGIEFISSIFDKKFNCLEELNELNLSFNPLRNESLRFLSKICNNLLQLKILKLSSCDITNLNNYNLNYKNLHEIDLSFNELNLKTIENLFLQLNSSIIEKLNLGFCIKEVGIEHEIVKFFNVGSCENLQYLDLSDCQLTDTGVYEILCSIKSKKFHTINLKQNTNLTSIAYQYLLNNSHTIKNINLDGCNKIMCQSNKL